MASYFSRMRKKTSLFRSGSVDKALGILLPEPDAKLRWKANLIDVVGISYTASADEAGHLSGWSCRSRSLHN